ncbi:hypothetical protein [Arthrobacter zhaoxinii]|uniref:hypothetical protein n=1 Tax=Arthrobacter zhaoxinii TaxID=2964616 RepID=UPI002105C449|nr:hypothetical protein [Arthrobacter zhaoxinii]MCQ2001451.1 hypothetical protein [Arthrobacter zhaoxinii]
MVRNPGLEPSDPRQLLYSLLEACGFCVVFSGPVKAEDLLEEAADLAPTLMGSIHRARGFFQLEQDTEITWCAVEGPLGSAILILCAPDADSGFVIKHLLQPLQSARPPLAVESVHLGSTTRTVADLVAGADVVPVWESPRFIRLRQDPDHYVTLPLWARRAAHSWERLELDMYRRVLQDGDGDTVNILFCLIGGRTLLLISIDAPPDALSGDDAWKYRALAAKGPYSLEHVADQLALVLDVPTGIDAAGLEDLSERMAADFLAGPPDSGTFDAPDRLTVSELPVADGRSLWDRLEAASEENLAGRPFHWPALARYTTTERIRESVPDSTFESANALAMDLRSRRGGSGFEYTWRASGDAPISPSWLTLQSACLDPRTGRAVASGHLTHEVWGLPPAYDLGAIDGRNGFTFRNEGKPDGLLRPSSSLYVGSSQSGVFLPLDSRADVISVDLHGATGTIAALEFLGGSTGAVATYGPDGQRRVLTVVEGIVGNEPIRFSGDGKWLLVSGSQNSTLIETAGGRFLVLQISNAAWWPLDESCLLTIDNDRGQAVPRLFNLATNSYGRSFPAITLDVPAQAELPHFWFPAVSSDGAELLALTPAGVSEEYRQKYGRGHRAAGIRLANGKASLLHTPFLDNGRLERDVREVRWTQRPPLHRIRLHPDLSERLTTQVTQHAYLSPARWADEAERILIQSLNRAIILTKAGQPVSHLLPEILASLVPVKEGPENWGRQSAWLIEIRNGISNEISNNALTENQAAAWRHYLSAIAAIQAGRAELIDPLATLKA